MTTLDPTQALVALEPASHRREVKASNGFKLLVVSFHFLVACVVAMHGGVRAQGPEKKYAQEYRQSFKGPPANPRDF